MESICIVDGKNYECDFNESFITFTPYKEYFIPTIIPFYAKNKREIGDFNEKEYMLEMCKHIDVKNKIGNILTGRLGYNDAYSMDGTVYLKPSYSVQVGDTMKEVSLQTFLNQYANTIELLNSEGYLSDEVANLAKHLKGDFKINETILNILEAINHLIGDFDADFAIESDDNKVSILVRTVDGIKFKDHSLKDTDIVFYPIEGKEYILPYLDMRAEYDSNPQVLTIKDIDADVDSEIEYLRTVITSFPIEHMQSFVSRILSIAHKGNIEQTIRTCKLINDECLHCDKINPALETFGETLNPNLASKITEMLSMARMMGQLGNESAPEGAMNFF